MATGSWLFFAANNGSTWGTAKSCNVAATGMRILDHGIKLERPKEATTGPGIVDPGELVGPLRVIAKTDLTMRWQYNGACPRLLAIANAADALTGVGPYEHSLTPAAASGLVGRYATIAWREIATGGGTPTYRYYEVPSAKIEGWTLRGTIGGYLEIVYHLVCSDLVMPATVNTSLASVTGPDDDDYQAVTGDFFAIAALGTNPASFSINKFELSCRWGHRGDHVSGTTSTTIPEPVDNEPRVATLRIDRPRKTDTTLEEYLDAGTQVSAQLNFTGTGNNKLDVYLPKLEATESTGSPPSGNDFIPDGVTFRVLSDFDAQAHATLRGFMDVDADIYQVNVTNDYSADYDTAL